MEEPKIGISGKGLNGAQLVQFVSNRVVNIVENGENTGHRHFFLFPNNFFKAYLPHGHLKLAIMWHTIYRFTEMLTIRY